MSGDRSSRLAVALTGLLALVLILVGSAESAHAQQVTASVDRETISINESVVLDLNLVGLNGRVGTPEGQDFTVQSTSTSMQMQVVNGRRSNSTTVTMMLRPMRQGDLMIGRIPIQTASGVLYTDPIAITVTEFTVPSNPGAAAGPGPVRPTQRESDPRLIGGPATARGPAEALSDSLYLPPVPTVPRGEPFIMASVTDGQPIAGQQLIVDYVLFTPASAFGVDGIELTEPAFSGAWFADVTDVRSGGFGGRLGTRRVGSELYEAQILRSYVYFPLHAGEVIVPPIELSMAFRGFSRRGGQRVVRSTPLLLDVAEPPVRDRPADFRSGNVGHYDIRMGVDERVARVGDTINLTISVHGSGLLSRLQMPSVEVDGARVFPADEEHTQEVASDLWMRGVARSRIAIVPQREGELIVPPITLSYFDPWSDSYMERSTPEVRITVSGVNAAAQTSVEAAPNGAWTDELPAERPISASAGALQQVHRSPGYLAALAFPPVAFLFLIVVSRFRESRSASAGDRRRDRAAAVAFGSLRGASAGEIAGAMRTYLADISAMPAGGLTGDQVRQRITSLANESAAETFASALADAEAARYGGEASADDLIAAATVAIRAVEEGR